jgi:hypothetical protein
VLFVATAALSPLPCTGGKRHTTPSGPTGSPVNELRCRQSESYHARAAQESSAEHSVRGARHRKTHIGGAVPPVRHALLPRVPAVFALGRHSSRVLRRAVTVIGSLTATGLAATAQQPTQNARPNPPPPDIYLAALTVVRGTPSVGVPMNFTDRPGYDNQPSFTDDGTAVFFTSVRDDAQADIYRYDLATRRTTRITKTAPESEYSATSIDQGRAISVVRVERDSTQRLWRIPLVAGTPTVILERIRPVGYHAWADDHTLALFVLGSPSSLQLADTRTGKADTIATGIGRSMHRMPGRRAISFVRKVSATEWWIESLDPVSHATSRLVRLPEGVEDYAWLPDGSAVCGRASALLWWSGKAGDQWRQIADFTASGVKGITRLAVNRRGDRLAFVAEGRP